MDRQLVDAIGHLRCFFRRRRLRREGEIPRRTVDLRREGGVGCVAGRGHRHGVGGEAEVLHREDMVDAAARRRGREAEQSRRYAIHNAAPRHHFVGFGADIAQQVGRARLQFVEAFQTRRHTGVPRGFAFHRSRQDSLRQQPAGFGQRLGFRRVEGVAIDTHIVHKTAAAG